MQYCQSLDLLCGQAVCFLCLCNIRRILSSHHACGNVEHICNTVLETADYEGHDREEDRPDLTDDIRSCRCHQDRNTYQNVTQDTGGNSFQRRNAYLADCHFDGISPQQSAGVVQISGKVDQGINDQRADQVAEIYHDQIADTFEPGHLFAYHVHDDQAVAGEKFSTYK